MEAGQALGYRHPTTKQLQVTEQFCLVMGASIGAPSNSISS